MPADNSSKPKRAILIKTKLILGFGSLFLFNLLYYYFSVQSLNSMNEMVNQTYDRALMSATFAQSCKAHFARCEQKVDQILNADSQAELEEAVKEARKEYENLTSDLEIVVERIVDSPMLPIIKTLQADIHDLGGYVHKITQRKSLKENYKKAELEWRAWPVRERIQRSLTRVADHASETGYRTRLSAEEERHHIFRVTYGFVAFILLLNIATIIWIGSTIFRPLRRLRSVCQGVSGEEYNIRAEVLARDELGDVALALNSMLDRIQEKDSQMAKLVAELSEKQAEIKTQVDAATQIQRSLLPPLKQAFSSLQVEALYQPCDQLSGDFFDTILASDRLYIYVADVTSHGMASAQVTYLIKEMFRQTLSNSPDIDLPSLYEKVRASYLEHKLEYDMGLHLISYHFKSRQLDLLRSNSPAPFLLEGEKGEQLVTSISPIISASIPRRTDAIKATERILEPNQWLYIYTDGAFEFETPAGKFFGQRRLDRMLQNCHHGPWPSNLLAQLQKETKSLKFTDDVTVLRLGLINNENQ